MSEIKTDDNNRIANNIYVLRKYRRDSRKNLAEAIGVAYVTMSAFENGTRPVHDEYIEKLQKDIGFLLT